MEPNAFDLSILHWLNQYVQMSAGFNHVVKHISLNSAFKGLPLMLAFWYLWFSEKPSEFKHRHILILALLGAFIAMTVALVVNVAMPFKARPYVNDELGLTPLLGLPDKAHSALFFVSTFPSDTSALFFAISMGMFYVSKRVGAAAMLYTLFVIALPRIYLRLHYPTDVIAGAAIGMLSVTLCLWADKKLKFGDYFDYLVRRMPAVSYTLLFFVSYQIVDLFFTLRIMGAEFFKTI